MVVKKLVGPQAGVRKYDLLTALAVSGLAGSPTHCTSMTRLIALVTARYNWRLEEVSIGQAELAKLWSVDTRTVKRELKRLRDLGVIEVKRPGVRGRVAAYCLDHARIDELTSTVWPKIGDDYSNRMDQSRNAPAPQSSKIISFPTPVKRDGVWGSVLQRLIQRDHALHDAWFAPLVEVGFSEKTLHLAAPSQFHANYVEEHLMSTLKSALKTVDPTVLGVVITVAGLD